jgi:hypothetical protein
MSINDKDRQVNGAGDGYEVSWLRTGLLSVLLALAGTAAATTQPDNMSVVIPIGTNNPAGAGAFSCNLAGTVLNCTGSLSSSVSVDDIELLGITFGGVTFDGTFGEIIPGLASVFLEGGGGTNVNAEWGGADNNDDGDHNPFEKAGFPIPPNNQETTNVDIIDATLRVVFRSLNLVEGIDGEDQNFRIRLDFERGVIDDDPGAIDIVPEIIVFERGLNSDVAVTLLLADGGESNELFVPRAAFRDSGIDINTIEINGGQPLGVVGIDLNEFSGPGFDPVTDVVVGVRFGSAGGGADIFGVYGASKNPVDLFDFGDAPEIYRTLLVDDGPRHLLSNDLYFGFPPDQEGDGQPSIGATGDGADEEVSIEFPGLVEFIPGEIFPIDLYVTNLTGANALACGWIDFNNDGEFDNADGFVGATQAERSCASVPNGSNSTGSVPDRVRLDFVVPIDLDQTNFDGFYSRFRITSDWTASSQASPLAAAGNGEIEDHQLMASTLPVSISSFDSRDVSGGLEIRWTTVAETHNAGYVIYGDRGRGVERLTAAPIAAIDGDPTLLRAYRHVLPGMRSSELRDIAVVAVDYHGKEEVYGLFEPGRAYGEQGVSSPLDWRRISLQAEQRMAALRAVRQREPAGKGGSSELGRGPSAPVAVDLKVTSAGLQEVSYETLRAAGLDLNGVAVAQIAVTVNGRAVARDVVPGAGNAVRGPALSLSKGLQGNNASSFGPGSVIRFWGERPAMPEALYVEDLFYRIELDADRALPAGRLEAKPQGEVALPLHWVRENRDLRYHFATPLESPWFAAQLRADRDNVYRTELLVDPAVDVQAPGRLKLVLAGMTDYPEAPDHRVVVEVNGKQVADHRFDGLRVVELDLALSGGTLHAGANEVRVIAPGGTDAPFDLFAVDTIDLGYARAAIALDDRLRVEGVQGGSAALRIDGYSDGNTVAYARQGETLVALASSQFGRGTVQVPTLAGEADYWVSTRAAVHAPAVVDTLQAGDLLAGVDADFLVIVHPAFLPLDENEPHPLNSYLAHRRAEGWRPALFDVTELQRRYAGGMALPEAVTRFLAEADARLDYEHVLLVGGDSYDYRDLLGLGSISFIPTRYAATRFIRHTPADALLADLDGDGLADKALGRWPVRSIGDLESIVTKTLDWDAGMRGSTGAVWVTDSEDPRNPSFTAQAERMMQPLLGQQWPVDALDRVYFDQVAPRPGLSVAASARAELFESLEQGRPVTGFVGHGSPTMWTFQGLLRPNDLADLDNQGKPTLITTMACYTSYFVSPHNETVAHRWMNGYQLDAGGAVIPGAANGAVAIHGAGTLSDYDHNERVAREVLNAQLDGATLGEAVQRGRARAKLLGLDDQVINWILLGDPTLRM